MCILLVLILVAAELPILSSCVEGHDSVPTFHPEQTDVKSQDNKWLYSIVLDKNEEPRVWITDYISNTQEETFVVPGTIDGMRVQSVSFPLRLVLVVNAKAIIFEENIERIAGCFFQLKDTEISLPSTLLMIDNETFHFSKNISVNFPDGLYSIGINAFRGCTFKNKTDIVFPESLRYIGSGAFENTNITSVKIGKKTNFSPAFFSQTAGVYYEREVEHPCSPFANCIKLKKVEIDENNPYLTNQNGVIYTADEKELIFIGSSISNFAIPESVEYIGKGIFNSKTFESLLISSNIVDFNKLSFDGATIGSLRFAEDCGYETISKTNFGNCKIEKLTIPKSVKTISNDAFYKCGIKELCFEEGTELNEIGERAFKNNDFERLDLTPCKLLTKANREAFCGNRLLVSVDMTDVPIEELSTMMFCHCDSLKEFRISKYTKTIGTEAFEYDSELEDINLGDVAQVYTMAFRMCDKINVDDYILSSGTTKDGYIYNEFENHVSLIGYTGEPEKLMMPDTINGKPVTDIVWTAHMVFRNQTINSIKFPSKLEFISLGAFQYTKVEEISEFPKTLRYIGCWAFSGCCFDEVTLNDGLEYVLSCAFQWCPLKRLEIPDSVIYYSGGMYNTEESLTFGKNVRNIKSTFDAKSAEDRAKYLYINPENPYFCFENGILYNKEKTRIYKCYPYYNVDEISEDYKLPDSVRIIDDNAFSGCSLPGELNIPKSTERIGKNAFADCSSLQSITIPAGTKYIGKEAFVRSSVTSVKFEDGFETETLEKTFFYCSSLQSAYFGKARVKKLLFTFYRTDLQNLEFPDGVENITGAYGYTKLNSVYELNLPQGLKVLANQAFASCELSITELHIPEGVSAIGVAAFSHCSWLKTIDFCNVKFLDRLAFENCFSLKSVDLTGILYIAENHGSGTFKDCKNLTKITYTKTGTADTIEEGTNSTNEAIDTVIIGNGIKGIENKAFANCTNLETAVIADSVKDIADNAFENCAKLTIICTVQSNAMLYAQRNHIRYKPFKVLPVPDQTYTGKAIQPPLHVSVGDTLLLDGTDYSVLNVYETRYEDAVLGAENVGDYDYAATVKFTILQKHRFTAKTVKPTATALGYTLYTCTICQTSFKDNFTAPTGKLTLKHGARTVNAIKVTWNNVKTATGYQVQISTKDGKKWSTYATLKAGTTAYTFKKLAAGTAYKFRVRFYIKAADGNNDYSPWSSTLTSPTLPTGTSLTKLTPAKKAFTAQWKKNAAVTGYQIQYSTNAKFTSSKKLTVKNNKTLKATLKKLSAKKVYYVRIRTCKTIAKVNYFSAWSKAYKAKTK